MYLKYIKNFYSSIIKKDKIHKNGQSFWAGISPINIYTWKYVQHQLPLGKWQSKPQWDSTEHQ